MLRIYIYVGLTCLILSLSSTLFKRHLIHCHYESTDNRCDIFPGALDALHFNIFPALVQADMKILTHHIFKTIDPTS
jgi:hypothetical protein